MSIRKSKLPAALYEYDFASLARKTGHGKTKLRLLGMAHLQEGKSFAEIGRMLKVSWIAVSNWLARFKKHGLEGLKEQHRSGRKSHLAKDDEEAFKAAVERLQAERAGGRVRGYDLQQLLKQDFKTHYSVDGVYALLKRLRLSWITARSMHPKADPVAQEAFKKTLRSKSSK